MSIGQIETEQLSERREPLPVGAVAVDVSPGEVVDLAMLMCFEEVQGEDEPDLIVELIDLYLDDAPRQLAVMRQAIETAEEQTLKRAAHSLKGSSSNLGVRRVAALCLELEQAAGDDTLLKAEQLRAEVEREFERARQILEGEKWRRMSDENSNL